MIISKKWINDYIDISDLTEEKIDSMLSLSGSSVETIEYPWKGLDKLIAGEIKKIENHPNADRLLVCTVYLGSEFQTKTILTADKTVEVGQIVPVALQGTVLFDGMEIKNTNMKGIISEGMMCSLEEMGLEEKSPTILKMSTDVKPGTRLADYYGLNDSVFDLEITSNRPDELSFLGVAREIHALTLGEKEINVPAISYEKSDFNSDEFASVEIKNTEYCPRYTALVLKDVKVEPSPVWLRRHLVSVGLRPINNIVDITNFVLMETGHPVHAFDLDKVKDGKIIVRNANKGEKLRLLDETEAEFDGSELLICDPEKALAVGGIMGGEFSGVTENTKDVLLEVAFFNPIKIRAASKKLNVSSDSSYRFERGVNPEDNVWVIERLAMLMQRLTGCKVAKSLIDEAPVKFEKKEIELRKERITRKLGIEVENDNIIKILQCLGFIVSNYDEKEQSWKVIVPVYRFDIEREIDLIEEIGRINGYDKVPSKMPVLSKLGNGRSDSQAFRYDMRDKVLALGYNEISPLSFIDPADFEKFGLSENHSWRKSSIELLKPLSKDISLMRTSQIVTLVKTVSYNYTRQISDLKFFEMGVGFKKKEEKYSETDFLTMGVLGRVNPKDYRDKTMVDFYSVKGDVEELMHSLGIKNESISYERIKEHDLQEIFYTSRAAEVKIEGKRVGVFGMVRKNITDSYDIKSDLYVSEINISELRSISANNRREWLSVSGTNYPASRKDFSVLVPKGKEIGAVITEIRDLELVESASIIDIYKGKNIPKDNVSITVSTVIRSSDHTITENELNGVIESIKTIFERESLELRE